MKRLCRVGAGLTPSGVGTRRAVPSGSAPHAALSAQCRPADHTTGLAPPSMLIAVPVVNPATSLHTKQDIAANSSGLPIRPSATPAPILPANASYGAFEPS